MGTMNNKIKRVFKRAMAILLTATLLVGFSPTYIPQSQSYAAVTNSPVVVENDSGKYDVTFYYEGDESADSVGVRGTLFKSNPWGTDGLKLEKGVDGVWSGTAKDVELGSYQYKFVVNGTDWKKDPKNPYTESDNSILCAYLSPEIKGKSVTFRYIDETAEKVSVAGTVNSWTPADMQKDEDTGVWSLTVNGLTPGQHQYKFIRDIKNGKKGDWINDPANPNKQKQGGDNNLFTIEEDPVVSPEVNGDSVTFRYKDASAKSVELMGDGFGDVDWAINDSPLLEKKADGLFELTVRDIPAGKYSYKYVVDGKDWRNDPNNKYGLDDTNNIFAIEGLAAPQSQSVKTGESLTLPTQLDLYAADGSTSKAAVTYALDGSPKGVTLTEAGELSVPEGFEEETISITASDRSGHSVSFQVMVVSTIYNYTIYYFDWNEDHMTTDATDLWTWSDIAPDGSAIEFTGTEELGGKTWLKAEWSTPFRDIGMKARAKGTWDGWQLDSDRKFKNTDKTEDVTLYIVNDPKFEDVYTQLPQLPEKQEQEEPLVSPEVKDNSVTFRYRDAGAKSVELMGGGFGDVDWNDDGKPLLQKNAKGIFELTIDNIPAGQYQYKYLVDGEWINDPYNTAEQIDTNNTFTIEGLVAPKNQSVKTGESLELPGKLVLYSADGSSSNTAVTYTLDDSPKGVTLTKAGVLSVPEGFEEETISITASDGNGNTVSFVVKVVSTIYNYTIYYFDWDEDHMTTDATDLWTWSDIAPDGTAIEFTGTEVLGDKTWLKAEWSTPSRDIGMKARAKGTWDDWQLDSDRKFKNTDKTENMTLYIVNDPKFQDVYTELPQLPEKQEQDENALVSPEVNGNSVTFRYRDANAKSVELMGDGFDGVDWNIDGKPLLEKKEGEDVFELTISDIPAGKYPYKFVVDGEWTNDPNNKNALENTNNIFVIQGLVAPQNQSVKTGGTLTLPDKLKLVNKKGSTSEVAVTYALDGSPKGVTLSDAGVLSVPEGFEGETIGITASDENGNTVSFKVRVVSALYNYTIYYYDWNEEHMNPDGADLWTWSEVDAKGSAIEFTGTEELGGKTWLKAEWSTPALELGMKARAKGTWDQWQMSSDRNFKNTDKAEELTLYIVNDPKFKDVYTEMPQLPEKQGRDFYVPGTFPGPSWDSASNQMEVYDEANKIYKYTFSDVPAANYEFKIAINGTWDENYGVGGKQDGSNYSVTVPETMDVTVYYSDVTKLAVTSVNYKFIEPIVNIKGKDPLKLTDYGLTGIYSGKISLDAGEYSGIELKVGDDVIGTFEPFTLEEGKEVNFYYAPVYGLYYTDAVPWNDDVTVKYDSKDLNYKDHFGAVPTDTDVTFAVETSNEVTGVILVVGSDQYVMERKDADSGLRWETTQKFPSIGEYDYFFVVAQAGGIKVYCDDDGYYGTGVLADLTEVRPYDLVVYEKGYKTPDWLKNAVIYQIFPDRFFNGDPDNDHAQETARGAVDYEYPEWNQLPSNPEMQAVTDKDVYEKTGAFWGDDEWANDMYGGDLEGITDKVKYLKDLGVNVIYLNPVFASISNHRYDTTDYTKIDPLLGDLEDFRTLVKAAYANGMHIVLDGVFNHVSDDSIYFDRYYKFLDKGLKTVGAYPYWAYVYDYMAEHPDVSQEDAEDIAKNYFKTTYQISDFSYTTWFDIYQTPLIDNESPTNEIEYDTIGERKDKPVYSYEGWWGYDSMPIIKSTNGSEYQTTEWADDIISGENSVSKYWLQQGSNGWRLDVANEVSDETWQEFRDVVKEESGGDAVIIGEIWDDATKYLMGDMYDSVMNYMFRNAVTGYAKGGDSQAAMNELEKLRERYPEEAFMAMMNLVDSHDTARVVSSLDGIPDDRSDATLDTAFPTYDKTSQAAKDMQKLVAFLQFTYAGAPTIYYGDERGMAGADDPDDRRTIDWENVTDEKLLEWYTKLGKLRSDYSALRTGSVEPIENTGENILGYVRRDDAQTMIVLANNSATDQDITLNLADLGVDKETLKELISGEDVTINNGTITVTVPARSGLVITGDEANPQEVQPLTPPDYDALDGNVTPPGGDEPGTDEPGGDEPGVDEPGVDEPGVDEPGVDEPGVDEPGVDEPIVDEPGTPQTPVVDDTEKPVVTDTSITTPKTGDTDYDSLWELGIYIPLLILALLSFILIVRILRRNR